MKKWLCEFKVDKPIEVKKTTKGKDDKGDEVDIVKTLNKRKPMAFKLQKPTRKQFEAGELYYAVKLSEGIKAGLLTTAQVAKRYENDGGVYTDAEKARLKELRNDITELQAEYFKLDGDGEEVSDQKLRFLSQINDARNEISDIENVHQYIYDQTAEVKARNKTILWWILQLAHSDKNNRDLELFGKGELDDRMDEYDKLEEDGNDFDSEVLKKLAYYVSYWYVSKNIDTDDFKTVESLYNQSSDYSVVEDSDEEPKAVEPVAEESKAEESKAEEPKAEEPKAEEPKAEEPKVEEPVVEEPKAEEVKEEPQAEEAKKEPEAEEVTKEPEKEEPVAETPA